jgi:ubiquitin C-terminal hydrolase
MKREFVYKSGKVLILYLKKFTAVKGVQKMVKTKVRFERTMDSSETFQVLKPDSKKTLFKYDLSGVIFHIGSTLDSGHYIAMSKRGEDYYMFDDDFVKRLSSQEVEKLLSSENALILFYTLNSA